MMLAVTQTAQAAANASMPTPNNKEADGKQQGAHSGSVWRLHVNKTTGLNLVYFLSHAGYCWVGKPDIHRGGYGAFSEHD